MKSIITLSSHIRTNMFCTYRVVFLLARKLTQLLGQLAVVHLTSVKINATRYVSSIGNSSYFFPTLQDLNFFSRNRRTYTSLKPPTTQPSSITLSPRGINTRQISISIWTTYASSSPKVVQRIHISPGNMCVYANTTYPRFFKYTQTYNNPNVNASTATATLSNISNDDVHTAYTIFTINRHLIFCKCSL